MEVIKVSYSKLAKPVIARLKTERPQWKHVERMINEEAHVYLDNKLIAVYQKVDFNLFELLKNCNSIKFSTVSRTDGMVSNTVKVGSSQRNGLRGNLCRMSKLNYIAHQKHEMFLEYGRRIAQRYKKFFPSIYANQVKETYVGSKRIESNYIIKGTPFTGAVVNKDSAMNYHYDRANTKDGLSCMLIMKENIAGGELILPELNIGFACQDGYMLLFDGQKYLHGVTEIIKATNGYRYTIVYYNNNGMHLCLPPEEELKYNQNWLDK